MGNETSSNVRLEIDPVNGNLTTTVDPPQGGISNPGTGRQTGGNGEGADGARVSVGGSEDPSLQTALSGSVSVSPPPRRPDSGRLHPAGGSGFGSLGTAGTLSTRGNGGNSSSPPAPCSAVGSPRPEPEPFAVQLFCPEKLSVSVSGAASPLGGVTRRPEASPPAENGGKPAMLDQRSAAADAGSTAASPRRTEGAKGRAASANPNDGLLAGQAASASSESGGGQRGSGWGETPRAARNGRTAAAARLRPVGKKGETCGGGDPRCDCEAPASGLDAPRKQSSAQEAPNGGTGSPPVPTTAAAFPPPPGEDGEKSSGGGVPRSDCEAPASGLDAPRKQSSAQEAPNGGTGSTAALPPPSGENGEKSSGGGVPRSDCEAPASSEPPGKRNSAQEIPNGGTGSPSVPATTERVPASVEPSGRESPRKQDSTREIPNGGTITPSVRTTAEVPPPGENGEKGSGGAPRSDCEAPASGGHSTHGGQPRAEAQNSTQEIPTGETGSSSVPGVANGEKSSGGAPRSDGGAPAPGRSGHLRVDVPQEQSPSTAGDEANHGAADPSGLFCADLAASSSSTPTLTHPQACSGVLSASFTFKSPLHSSNDGTGRPGVLTSPPRRPAKPGELPVTIVVKNMSRLGPYAVSVTSGHTIKQLRDKIAEAACSRDIPDCRSSNVLFLTPEGSPLPPSDYSKTLLDLGFPEHPSDVDGDVELEVGISFIATTCARIQKGRAANRQTVFDFRNQFLTAERAKEVADAIRSGKTPEFATFRLGDNGLSEQSFATLASAVHRGPRGLHLDFTGEAVSAASLRTLADHIRLGPEYLKLTLRAAKLTTATASELLATLGTGKAPYGLALDLSDNALEPAFLRDLARVLPACKEYTAIVLAGNRLLSDAACSHLEAILSSGRFPDYFSIDLGDCGVTSAGCAAVARGLSSGKARWGLSVDLSRNALALEGFQAVRRALESGHVPRITTLKLRACGMDLAGYQEVCLGVGNGQCPADFTLCVSGNEIGPEGGAVWCHACGYPAALAVDLSATGLGDEGAEKLAAALRLGVFSPWFRLDLSDNGIGPAGFAAICRALASGKCPAHLWINLSRNQVCAEGVAVLADAFTSGNSPPGLTMGLVSTGLTAAACEDLARSLTHSECPLAMTLDLASNALGPEACRHFADALKTGRTPHRLSLNLSSNGVTAAGCRYLADILSSPSCPQELILDLSHNNIGVEGCRQLNDAVKKTRAANLTLDLSGSTIGLSQKARTCPPGVNIVLSNNQLTADASLAFAQAIRLGKCPAELNVDLSNNHIGNDGRREICKALKSGKYPANVVVEVINNI
ncbi:RAN GTPase-activating protein 1 [Diplonema papillatum]|nr:RAN GTPase-activating protein 1 [Diplonema papillatum]